MLMQRAFVCIVCGEILAEGEAGDPSYGVQPADGDPPRLSHDTLAAIRAHAKATGHRRVRLEDRLILPPSPQA